MAKPRAVVHGVAVRYASALFELADEDNLLDAVHQDLQAMQQMVAASEDLRWLLRNPLLPRQAQVSALTVLGQRAGFSKLTVQFLGLLASNRRLFALADITAAYRLLLADHRGITQVQITVAAELDESQRQALLAALSTAVGGGEVDMQVDVDAGLIGGLVARVGSRMIDASIRSRLGRMRIAMQEAN